MLRQADALRPDAARSDALQFPGSTLPNARTTLTDPRTFARFDSTSRAGSLGSLSADLLREQLERWPRLESGYASLKSVQLREVRCGGFSAWLQFNPGRIVSTGANVDASSIRARRCFLCQEHLPPEQKGILYDDDFLVLCNPAPIFQDHFTISHVRHVPQSIEPFVPVMLRLADDLSPRATVFYNGPRCGASAPDHMHFQASPRGKIPVEQSAVREDRREQVRSIRGVEIMRLRNLGREVLVMESAHAGALERVLVDVIRGLRNVLGGEEEPMVNILCSRSEVDWRVILFPRSKHRPDVYFKEGDGKILISPAAVDIGGLIVTPLEKDFLTVDAATIESIFAEVSLPESVVRDALSAVS